MKDKQFESVRLRARNTLYMACMPADRDRAGGTPISVVTLAEQKSGEIALVILSLHDSRQLARDLLVSLASSDDGFAAKVLEEMFSVDGEGNYRWPEHDSSM